MATTSALESLTAFKDQGESLLRETEKCLDILRKSPSFAQALVLEDNIKPWARKVAKFCEEQKKAADAILGSGPPPAEPKASEPVDSGSDVKKPETKEVSNPVVDSSPPSSPKAPVAKESAEEGEKEKPEEDQKEDAPPPLPVKAKPRKPKAKGRELLSKNLLATRAKEEVSSNSATKTFP